MITEKIQIILVFIIAHLSMSYCAIVIAHRAASAYLPEQTFEAAAMAYTMSSDFIELDVILSKDNHLMVTHDIVLDEVTNVAEVFPTRNRNDSHYYVIDFTFDELRQLKVVERFTTSSNVTIQKYPNRFPFGKSSFKLHNLEEELELLQGLHKSFKLREKDGTIKEVGILIEIKRPYYHSLNGKNNLSEILLETLKRYGYNENSKLILQSFDPYELMRIKFDLKSNIRLVQLLTKELDYPEEIGHVDYDFYNSYEGLKQIKTYAIGIAPEKDLLVDFKSKNEIKPSEMYDNAKKLNLSIFPWTFRVETVPNYATKFETMVKIFNQDVPVNGIITDFADLTISYLKSSSSKLFTDFQLLFLSFCAIIQRL